jgi:hypothetical protein
MTDAATMLKTVFPGRAKKALANGTGCSLRQSQRILTTGKIPARLKEAVYALVARAIAQRQAELEAIDDALKVAAYSEMVDRASARRADVAAGQAARPEAPAVNGDRQ